MPEAPPSPLAVYRAWPTVRIDGRENERVRELVLSMEIREQEHGLSNLELRLQNVASDPRGGADFAFEDESALSFGKQITIYSGDENSPREIFRGRISALEADFPEDGAPELVVLAEDVLQRARFHRQTATYEQVSLIDIASRIAQRHRLTPRIDGFSNDTGTYVQLNESDLAFLRRLLARFDGDVQVVGDELHVSPRDRVRRGELTLELGSQLRRATVIADLAHQITESTVAGWSVPNGAPITGRSTGSHRGPGQGRTGASILSSELGQRSHHVSHLAVATSDEARALADAVFDQRQRRFVKVNASAEGNPLLRVGTHVTLAGLGPRFSNTYYLTSCCHRFDLTQGYRTDFTGECAFLGNP